MQGFGYNGKRLYRYELTIVTTEYGSTEQIYERENRSYWVNIIPSTKSQSRNEYGVVSVPNMTIIVNDTHDFKIGDRLGTEGEQLYEVVSVSTFMTNQQMEVKDCQPIP